MTRVLLDSRKIILALVLGSAIWWPFQGPAKADPPKDWQTIAPADAGFHPGVAEQLDEAVRSGKLKNIHAVVVVRDGKLVFERYYEGSDEFWAMQIGTVKFDPNLKHDLRSATKSIVGLLYGIALSEGKVPALDAVLIDQFPAYKDLAADPMRRRMTVRHALSMTLGIEWPESSSTTYADNPELGMYLATDPYRFIFEHAMIAEPGNLWNYNGGATALLGHLIAEGTGKPLFRYAREKLFEPLGISEVQWVGGTNGEVSAASGLRMRPRDFAKIGQLVLNQGRWGDQQVVPAEWLAQALAPQAKVQGRGMGDSRQIEYGYQWWLIDRNGKQPWIAARGNGGQTITLVPKLDLVIAINAGNYNSSSAASMAVITDVVLPALQSN